MTTTINARQTDLGFWMLSVATDGRPDPDAASRVALAIWNAGGGRAYHPSHEQPGTVLVLDLNMGDVDRAVRHIATPTFWTAGRTSDQRTPRAVAHNADGSYDTYTGLAGR